MRTAHYQSDAGIVATLLTYASFALGTVMLILCLLLPYNDGIVIAGCHYVLLAFVINAFTLSYLLYCLAARSEYRKYYAQKIFLLLCNIPVAGLYIYVFNSIN